MVMPEPLDRRLLLRVLNAFGLGEPTAMERLPVGTLNHNWRVDTPLGPYAVKQVLDRDPEGSRLQHAVADSLADKGFPVPRPVRTSGGDTLAELNGEIFSVVPWVEGTHRPGADLSLAECGALGVLLGEIQQALGGMLPPVEPWSPVVSPDPTEVSDQIEAYLAAIDDLAEPDEFDAYVRHRLRERLDLLSLWVPHRPADGLAGPVGWTHGDFHENNVLWRGGRVAAVLDWDRLCPAPLAGELVRSASYTFGGRGTVPDLTRIAAYARGYRSVVTLTDAEVTDATDRRWWDCLTGLWPLKLRYERGDISCDHFFPGQCELLAWWCENREAMAGALLG